MVEGKNNELAVEYAPGKFKTINLPTGAYEIHDIDAYIKKRLGGKKNFQFTSQQQYVDMWTFLVLQDRFYAHSAWDKHDIMFHRAKTIGSKYITCVWRTGEHYQSEHRTDKV